MSDSRLRAAFAALALVAASCATDPAGPPATTSAVLRPVAGDDQVGRADRPLSTPLQVRVERDGAPAAGAEVVWHTLDGSLEPSGLSDAEGLATAVWTLPPRRGAASASARLGNDDSATVVFHAEARVPDLRIVGGNDQNGTAGETLPEPLQVLVTWDGEPLVGEPVQWSFLSAPVLTGPDGIASTTWTVGPTAGNSLVMARIGRLADPIAYFNATAAPGPLATLVQASLGPRHWSHGLGIRLHALARDIHGNTIGGLPVEWSVVTGAGTVEGTGTDATGMAYVDVMPADDYAGDFQVRAVAEGVEMISQRRGYAHFMFVNPTGWGDYATQNSITVSPGTTVRWAHYGLEEHRLGPRDGTVVRIPESGGVLEQSFATAGVHEWICAEHYWETFTIVVAP